jgi:histidyl-tRNA synthetase
MAELRTPPGTFDVLAPESGRWEALLRAFASVVEGAGYQLLITPTFEDLAVFQRVGASTDVVRKEMYDFDDKGGRRLALRPEVTASVARAFVQHRPPTPWKTWYAATNFRYERPQAGRYREFHQVGVEAYGVADPDLDVEVVALGWDVLQDIGLHQVDVLVNSLGDAVCRPSYRALLLDYLRAHRDELCDEHRARFEDNPMRVLDCKKSSCQAVAAGAPRQVDHLCDDCAAHLTRVRAGLDALGVPYTLDPSLVRGLDYYTRTAFEYTAPALATANNAVGGGGRYDGLVEEMGGPPTPAIGFALGVERILLAVDAEPGSAAGETVPSVEVFVVDFAGGEAARDLTTKLRRAGVRADRAYDGRSARAQFRAADRSGARLALVVGPDERAAGEVLLKDLHGDADQYPLAAGNAVEAVRKTLGR